MTITIATLKSIAVTVLGALSACATSMSSATSGSANASQVSSDAAARLAKYTTVRLAPDLSALAENERKMIPLLVDAAREMDEAFWMEAYSDRYFDKFDLLKSIADPAARRLAEVNYGPWDRLDDNHSFVPGVGTKPPGANYYPRDLSKAEFEAELATGGARADSLKSLYTMIRRDSSGRLFAIPFSRFFQHAHDRAAQRLEAAAALAEEPGLRAYLTARARALRTDDYQPSDLAWMDMKNNTIDVIIGPIETYEDELFGYKAAHETFVLVKDRDWSRRLARYATLLPGLQRGIPVAEEYKRETPGTDSELNAYDVVYVSGQANSGAKTIAINLPDTASGASSSLSRSRSSSPRARARSRAPGGGGPNSGSFAALNWAKSGLPFTARMVTGTGPTPSSSVTRVSEPERLMSPMLASTNAVPMVGWPAKGSSVPGVKMRTLRVCCGSFGGRTNVVSEKLNSRAMRGINSAGRSFAFGKTAS